VSDSTGNDPRPPSDIDPEQLRQFQEFQRFQEYQRFQQAQQGTTPPALPPGEHTPAMLPPGMPPPVQPIYVKPEPKPWWKVVLTNSLVKWIARWVLLLLILAFAANWAYNRYFGGGDEPGDVAKDSGGVIAPLTPYGLQGTVGIFYKHVSQDSAPQACNLFAEDGNAKKKFTEAISAPDCETAIHTLRRKVLDVSQYEQPYFPDSMLKGPAPNEVKVEVSSCRDLTVNGGPKLGKFVLSKQAANGGWIITDYEAEPADCVTG
jgi:hypothetical protein